MAGCGVERESLDRRASVDLDHLRESGFDDRFDAILLYLEACPVTFCMILRVAIVRILGTGIPILSE
jgi:hypothetical protein